MYTTKEAVEKYLGISISETIDEWINAIQKFIDNYTGTRFEISAEETRYFDGNGKKNLLIDECVSVSKVEVKEGESWYEISDYYLYPLNSTPKFQILNLEGIFPKGNKNVRITGKFGFSETPPDDIKLVATILVAGVYNNKRRTEKEIKTERIGDYSVSFDEKQFKDFEWAMKVLKSYRLWKF